MTIQEITLTEDQQNALEAFYNFLMDPVETVFVLRGYSGCGKSTLVRTLIDRMPAFNRTAKLINPTHKEYEIALTATTNKAQGSTFDRVFVDLDDIRRCNSGDQIARMLYVGVSRARTQVFLTGDLV